MTLYRMYSIAFKDLTVVHIVKTNLKNSYISVERDATITLKTPRVSQTYLEKLLEEKEDWIRKKLLFVQNTSYQKPKLEDEILLFGEVLSIDSPQASYLREKLSGVSTDNKQKVLACYQHFYLRHAKEYLPQRVAYFANEMGLAYETIHLKKLKSRWGSCDSRKIITLNTRLIKIDKKLIDYVVVHELAHLVHMNHSKAFHSLVERYLPHAKALRKELKQISMVTLSFDD